MKNSTVVHNAVKMLEQDGRRLLQEFYSQKSIELSKALLGKVLARKLRSGEILRGTIVETEAYPGPEEATTLGAHCFITKKTEKNVGIFKEPGTTWVYMTYGVFNMINISALGDGSATLLRAGEPKDEGNLELMQHLRLQKKSKIIKPQTLLTDVETVTTKRFLRKRKPDTAESSSSSIKVTNSSEPEPLPTLYQTKHNRFKTHELANGPGKLCKVFSIEKANCDQVDLTTSDFLWIEDNDDSNYHDGNFTIVEATRVGIDSAPTQSQKDLFRFYILDNFSVSTIKPSQIKMKLLKVEDTALQLQ